MGAIKAKEHIWYVGVQDPDLRVFDIIMHSDYGTSYNAYLVQGTEKTVLFETSKAKFFDEFLDNIRQVIPVEDVDYLIMNHNEPDHSGSVAKLMAVLSLTLPFFFGMERESGVWILIRSAGAGRTVSRRKRAAAWLFALVVMLAAYLPRLLAVGKEVGLPELGVRANSLALFASLPNVLPLWGVLVLTMVVRGALAVGGAAAIELLSARIKSSLICVLGSILILVGLVWLTGGLL